MRVWNFNILIFQFFNSLISFYKNDKLCFTTKYRNMIGMRHPDR